MKWKEYGRKTLFLYLPGVTEENNDNPQSGMSVSHLRSEVDTTQIQGRSVNHMGQLAQ